MNTLKKELNHVNLLLSVTFFTALVVWFFYAVYILEQTSTYAENGLLENAQVITLLLASILFLQPVFTQKREDKLVLLFFTLLCLSFILREVDVERLNVPDIFVLLGSGIGRNLILGSGFIGIIAYALLNMEYYKKLAVHYLFSTQGILLITAGTILLLAGYFEHDASIPHHVFLEEIIELCGYGLIFLSALIFSNNALSDSQ